MLNLTEESTQLGTEEEISPTMAEAKTTEEVSPTRTKTKIIAEASPTVTVTKTKPEASPTVTKTKAEASHTVTITQTNDEDNQELITSHLPGINPVDILMQFEKAYNLDCLGWEYFSDVWLDECISTGFKDPSYGFTVFSRNEDTVDYIEASVLQIDNPNVNIILSYFEEVLSLPYEGSNPDEILNWIESEIPSLNSTPGDIRQLYYSNVSYKLYGDIFFFG
jgi:hypothetical protein